MDKNFRDIVKSKNFKIAVASLGVLVFTILVFHAGMSFGFHRAKYSLRWGDNYNRIVGRNDKFGMMDRVSGREFFNPDGSFGKIVKISLPSIFVSDNEGIEKELKISTTTVIRKFKNNLKQEELKLDDFVVSVGKSNEDGSIEAKLIRVMPEAPTSFMVGGGMMGGGFGAIRNR
jgi:hypothetical protein